MDKPIKTTQRDEVSDEMLMNVEPCWEEWADDPAEIAKRQTKLMRKKYPSKLMRQDYEDSFSAACYRAELPKWQARMFMSHLIEDITGQLLSGKIIHIPGLGLFALIPISSTGRFRVHFCADTALRLCVSEEANRPCENLEEFRKRCHAIAASLPSYRKRGITYTSLTANERRKLGRQRREWEEKRAIGLQEFVEAKRND